jgi:hypothetical protein
VPQIPELIQREKLQQMLRPYDGDDFEMFPVSTVVNNARNDVEECVQWLEEDRAVLVGAASVPMNQRRDQWHECRP